MPAMQRLGTAHTPGAASALRQVPTATASLPAVRTQSPTVRVTLSKGSLDRAYTAIPARALRQVPAASARLPAAPLQGL